jgi:hypothetical protein
MTTVALTGLQSGMTGEERALANIEVQHNGQTYDWQIFVPPGVGLSEFIDSSVDRVAAEIDAKEAEWVVAPKTREIEDPMTGEKTTVDIQKSEVVRPDIPDYYAKRRAEYPPIAEQMGAMWKGGQAMTDMQAKIQAVKDKYPKP